MRWDNFDGFYNELDPFLCDYEEPNLFLKALNSLDNVGIRSILHPQKMVLFAGESYQETTSRFLQDTNRFLLECPIIVGITPICIKNGIRSFVNDGAVPVESALLEGSIVDKKVTFNEDLDHFDLCKKITPIDMVLNFLHAPITNVKVGRKSKYQTYSTDDSAYLTIDGTAFGNIQGTGSVWLRPKNDVQSAPSKLNVISWRNEEIICTWDSQTSMQNSYSLSSDSEQNSLQSTNNQYEVVVYIDEKAAESSHDESRPESIIVTDSMLSSRLSISKTCLNTNARKGDVLTYIIKLENNGWEPINNVTVTDLFPHELSFVSSNPQGVSGKGKYSFNLGVIEPGDAYRYVLKFRVNDNIRISDGGLTITNKATASSLSGIYAEDQASVIISPPGNSTELQILTNWQGINTKESEGNVGKEITLQLKPDGGSSPYNVSIDWGDGVTDKLYDITGDNWSEVKHTYNQAGEYSVTITVMDQFARTVRVKRTLHIK